MKQTEAALLSGTAVATAQLLGARWSPSPNHPRTAAWYAALRKPSFTPPGPVFAIAWTGLDVLLGYSGYRLLTARASPTRTAALGTWALNILGVAGFSWVLFGRKRLDEALEVTAGMVASAAAAAGTASLVDRRAGYAALPLLAWVTFAAVLQEEVWRQNR
jgi:tryptophan-rich sensory protein